jgi:DNA repair protein RadD
VIPRDYQRAAVAAARTRTAAHGDTVLVLPTGGGKTAVAAFYIAAEAADDPAARFLVLQHTDELIEQNHATVGRITGLPGSIVKAGRATGPAGWSSAASRRWPGPTGAPAWRPCRTS